MKAASRIACAVVLVLSLVASSYGAEKRTYVSGHFALDLEGTIDLLARNDLLVPEAQGSQVGELLR